MKPSSWNAGIEIAKDRLNGEGNIVKTYYWYRSLEEFVSSLAEVDRDAMWYYEVIPGDTRTPMYFDVEWYGNCGSFSSPEAVIGEVVQQFGSFLLTTQCVNVTEPSDWYVLRASGDEALRGKVKFSYHLICRSGWAVSTARDRKRIFRSFTAYLLENHSPLCKLPDDHGGERIPLDGSVYSNWQTLRTIWSTKLGSRRALIPVDLTGCVLEITNTQAYHYFVRYLTGDECNFEIGMLPEKEISKDFNIQQTQPLSQRGLARISRNDLDEQLVTEPAPDVTMLENDRSIPFYLRCIPNAEVGQPWEIYFAVAAAVERSGGTFAMFQAWAEKSLKFRISDADQLWKSLSTNNRPLGYNEGTLRRFATKCAPWAFRITNMDFHTRLPVQRYNSRFMEPLPQDVDLVIAQSPMGSGKTYSIAKFIAEVKPKRGLLVSSRRTYAENATADLNNRLPKEFAFQKYSDLDGSLGHVPYLTVQMESLHRLKNAPPYDILVIDEVEACFKQFSSPTMLTARHRLTDNLQVFEKIYRSAGKKILLDAFISQRTIDFAEWMATEQLGRGLEQTEQTEQTEQLEQKAQTAKRNGILVVNENVPRARNAYQYSSHATWEDVLVRKLDEGKRLVIFWGSKKKGDDFEKFLKETYPHLTVKFYTSECDDLLDKDLENVRDSWKEVDVLMYTAKITVGVNFDTEDVFDSLFVYGAAGGCTAREVIQATMRVRHLRDDSIHYFISGGGYHKTEQVPTLSNLESLLAKKRKYLDDISVGMSVICRKPNLQNDSHQHQILQMIEWGEEKEWMVRIHLQNLLEEEKSKCKFSTVFRDFLKRAGYTCHFDAQTVLGFHATKCTGIPYSDIPLLSLEQKDLLLGQKQLTAAEKTMLKKFYFVPHFRNAPERCLEVLWEFWENPHEKQRLDNIRTEQTSQPVRNFRQSVRTIQLKSFIPETVLQFHYLRQLLDVLGVKSSFDTETIVPHRVVENLAGRIDHLKDPLTTSFQLRQPRIRPHSSSRCSDLRQTLEFINKVLTAWSNSRLVACLNTRKQYKKDGKKYSTYDYRLQNKFEQELCNVPGCEQFSLSTLFSEKS